MTPPSDCKLTFVVLTHSADLHLADMWWRSLFSSISFAFSTSSPPPSPPPGTSFDRLHFDIICSKLKIVALHHDGRVDGVRISGTHFRWYIGCDIHTSTTFGSFGGSGGDNISNVSVCLGTILSVYTRVWLPRLPPLPPGWGRMKLFRCCDDIDLNDNWKLGYFLHHQAVLMFPVVKETKILFFTNRVHRWRDHCFLWLKVFNMSRF